MDLILIIKFIASLILILYGLIFMIWANAISKAMGKTKDVKKDPNRKKKVFIWGLVSFLIGVILLIFLI